MAIVQALNISEASNSIQLERILAFVKTKEHRPKGLYIQTRLSTRDLSQK